MVNRPRGTRDFAPDEMHIRNWAAQQMRAAFTTFGFQEVQTPAFEELELFTAKSGDGIISELYNFQDKGERDMTLRPELTAPVMRMYFQDHAFDAKPIKWFYHGPCYRYDRPQAGRYREFWQFGCELIGAGTPLAYAELIACADAVFDSVGLKERQLKVGHVAILRAVVDGIGLEEDMRSHLMREIDKVDKIGTESIFQFLAEHAGPEAQGRFEALWAAKTPAEARDALNLPEMAAAFDELEQCFALLEHFEVEARMDLGIARGLDYYNGIVFECHSPALGAQSQLMGGGGYDLSHLFGGQETPTMGFGIGFDRTLVALENEGTAVPEADGPIAYFGSLGDAAPWVATQVTRLRSAGLRIDQDLQGRKPGAIAKAADAHGARHLIIVGDRDLESGEVNIKDLRDGTQYPVPVNEVRHWLLNRAGIGAAADFD